MLHADERKYLLTLNPKKKVKISVFDPRAANVAREIIFKVNQALPKRKVLFIGATALGIAGQNDIDLNILSRPQDYPKDRQKLEKVFGKPAKKNPKLVKWEFIQRGFEVELYLTDENSPSLRRQIRIFKLLQKTPLLRKQYEKLKLSCKGMAFREYMRKKFVFFHKILGEDR